MQRAAAQVSARGQGIAGNATTKTTKSRIRLQKLQRGQFHRSIASSSNSSAIQAAPGSSTSSIPNISLSSQPSAASSPTSSSSSSTSSSSLKSPSSGSSSKGPASLSRRRNTDLALILSGSLGLSALLFYTLRSTTSDPTAPTSPSNLSALSPSSKSFTLPIHTSSGLQLRTISMLPSAKVNEILTTNERTYSISRSGNPLYRYDTNSVASNEVCEDTQAFTILEHEGKDWILASVFDGHSGYHTSRLLAEQLEKYIGRELMEVFRGGYRSLSVTGDTWWNWLWHAGKEGPKMPDPQLLPLSEQTKIKLDEKAILIPEALRTAYKLADRDIVQTPIDFLKSLLVRSSSSPSSPQISEAQRSRGLSLLGPALSGSCSLTALIDTTPESQRVYVAVAGDSRAVMGTYDETSQKWITQTLSEDQTGRNLNEVKRMRSEHPKDESEKVIMRGRVLGGLEPTRSLGDAKYKWPVGMTERLIEVFRPSSKRTCPPELYKTPPYVTADPVVTTFPLSSPIVASAAERPAHASSTSSKTLDTVDSARPPKRPRHFIVLATDGLYDCLSSEEVVGLVAHHLDGTKSTQSRSELLSKLTSSKAAATAEASPHKPRTSSDSDGENGFKYVFEDTNICTHLVRNALGGAAREQVSALLSIPPPQSRRYRDDITITVLLLGDDFKGVDMNDNEERLPSGVQRVYTTENRAKL